MSKELAKEEVSQDIINSLILTGDMSKLSPTQQTQYYTAVCKSIGVNPLTQPFAIITLQGKKILYATKGCTQQLCDNRKINTEIKKTESLNDVFIANCRATMPDGRYTDDIGAVSTLGIKGAEVANAMMKSITKAKRRAVLALCGLGMPDETEVEEMVQHPAAENSTDPNKSRVENIIDSDNKDKVEDAVISKSKDKDEKKSSSKKEKNSKNTIQGVIEGQPRTGEVEGKGVKYLFKIKDREYGTFDESIIKEMMDIVDMQQKKPNNKFFVELEYNERESDKNKGKMFYDIIKFHQFTTDEVPI